MGFRNPFRIQVDENDVAYVSDYSPDSQTPQQFHGPSRRRPLRDRPPAGATTAGRTAIKPDLPEYPWNVNLQVPMDAINHQPTPPRRRSRTPARAPTRPEQRLLERPRRSERRAGPARRPRPDSSRDLVLVPRQQRGGPARDAVLRLLRPDALTLPPAPGSTTSCPRLFPELFTSGVGPHGMAKYHYDAANPNPSKFPPYYNDSIVLGEFTQDTLRELKLDSQNRVFKINPLLNCGQANSPSSRVPVRVRQPDGPAMGSRRRRSTCSPTAMASSTSTPTPACTAGSTSRASGAPLAAASRRRDQRGRFRSPSTSRAPARATPSRASRSRFDWNFGDGSAALDDPEPEPHLHRRAAAAPWC